MPPGAYTYSPSVSSAIREKTSRAESVANGDMVVVAVRELLVLATATQSPVNSTFIRIPSAWARAISPLISPLWGDASVARTMLRVGRDSGNIRQS